MFLSARRPLPKGRFVLCVCVCTRRSQTYIHTKSEQAIIPLVTAAPRPDLGHCPLRGYFEVIDESEPFIHY